LFSLNAAASRRASFVARFQSAARPQNEFVIMNIDMEIRLEISCRARFRSYCFELTGELLFVYGKL
jgi:hypothetical protein